MSQQFSQELLQQYTHGELMDRRAFIISEIEKYFRAGTKDILYYSKLADQLEYTGITRQETFNAVHFMERQGRLIRKQRRGRG